MLRTTSGYMSFSGGTAVREKLPERALALAGRHPCLGIGPNVVSLALTDLWGVYRLLHRVANV